MIVPLIVVSMILRMSTKYNNRRYNIRDDKLI
jgi:hypothetical protein